MKQILLVLLFTPCILGFKLPGRSIHIFMIGDSTMADKDPKSEPERGWGQALPDFIDDTLKISNYAVNGRSSKSFINEGRWQAVLKSLQAGDYVIIQFGHNDQKPDEARHTDPFNTYKNNLEKFIADSRAKGAFPILCTPIVRRKFDEMGALVDTHGQYPKAVRQTAKELNVPLLDLELSTKNVVSKLGPEESKSLYLYASPGACPNRPGGVQDDTHLNPQGAAAVALMAVQEMKALKLPIANHLKTSLSQTPQERTIVVSVNGRFFQDKNGLPFFWLGDTAWNLFQRLNREEIERYLENRSRKGFNVIQAVAFHGSGEKNAYGSEALLEKDAGHPKVTPGNDFSKPEEYDYWDHIDWVIERADQKGLYIAFLPVWGSSVKTNTLNAENAAIYAKFLAARYKGRPNIFWVLGGDIVGDIHPEVWNILGGTLSREDPNHLITYHPFGRTQSSMWFHNEAWLDFNMFQSGHRRYDQDDTPKAKGEDNWLYVREDYARLPPKPTLDGEPSYENIPQGLHDPKQPYWTDTECRRYAYWSVLAGSAGHTYGNNAVMQMHKPDSGPGAFGVRNYWYEAIDEPGAGQMQYLKKLVLSRPYLERVPDQSLIAGENGVRENYIVAARGNSYLLAYTYTGRPFQIHMGIISGKQVRAWWYDPRNGSARQIGVFRNQGVHAFTPPNSPMPGNDWVLILDDSEKKFTKPGAAKFLEHK